MTKLILMDIFLPVGGSPVAGGGPMCISICPKFLFRFLLGVPRSNKKSRVDILYPGNFLDNDVISLAHIFSRNPVIERNCNLKRLCFFGFNANQTRLYCRF